MHAECSWRRNASAAAKRSAADAGQQKQTAHMVAVNSTTMPDCADLYLGDMCSFNTTDVFIIFKYPMKCGLKINEFSYTINSVIYSEFIVCSDSIPTIIHFSLCGFLYKMININSDS